MRTRTRSACAACRRMKIRCKGNTHPCTTCVERGHVSECKFTEHYVPYDHYALIYLDADGEIKVDESHSTQEQNSTLFTADARRKFLEKQGLDSAEPMSYPLDASSQAAKCHQDERGFFTSNGSPADQILGTESRKSDNWVSTEEASITLGTCGNRPLSPVPQGAANLTPIDTMSYTISAPLSSSNPMTTNMPSDYTDYPMQSIQYSQAPELISLRYALVPDYTHENTATPNPHLPPATLPYHEMWNRDFGGVIFGHANYATQP